VTTLVKGGYYGAKELEAMAAEARDEPNAMDDGGGFSRLVLLPDMEVDSNRSDSQKGTPKRSRNRDQGQAQA